jgi:hypothetical protein
MKQTITLEIPKQLELICQLLEITPQQVLQNFIDDVSLEVNSSGGDERRMAVEYFMRVGYGMHRYEFDQVEQMFDGLNWLRCQWPGNDAEKEKQYLQERRKFLKQWFKEWKAKESK